jgi:hypothetical protein
MILSETDRTHIRELLRAATCADNLVSISEIDDVLCNVPGAREAVMEKSNSVRLESQHLVVYGIVSEEPLSMEHLSISHPDKLIEQDVLTIAVEFGLGDPATWTMHMPPIGRMRAYHIMRRITPNGTE